MNEKNFGHLGQSFQVSLLKTIIEDKIFARTIIDVMESKYFDGPYFRYIMENIKEMYNNFNAIPSYETLAQKLMSETNKDTASKMHMDTLKSIQEHNIDIPDYIKSTSLNFCKQQVLKKAIKDVHNIIENGDFEEYTKIEKLVSDALQVGATSEGAKDVFDNIQDVFAKDTRVPIPTGINGIDNLLKGGLGMGELGIVLAPTGTGKTTLLTLFANTAFNTGKNVLQIFFEDSETNIKKKHFTIWSGISPNDHLDNIEDVIKVVEEKKNSENFLKLLKLPSFGVTVSDIKSIVRKMEGEGNRVDLLLIDYIDCLSSEKNAFGEEWKGEGSIMRQLESMTSEFNFAIWTATQGNRESISSEVVTGDQMGGSIKKAQVAHVIISIAKTLEQKEHNLGTLTLLKSRIGQDGVIFNNCKFNNEMLVIDTDSQNTLLGHEQEKVVQRANRAAEVYKTRQDKKTVLTNN
jgi:replicative DNA helicase